MWAKTGDQMPHDQWSFVRLPLPVNAKSAQLAIRWRYGGVAYDMCAMCIDDVSFPALQPRGA